MKKLTSAQSTREESVLYTDFSVMAPVAKTQQSLARIINHVKKIIKTRIEIYSRDIDEIFELERDFFITFLNTFSSEELWDLLIAGNGLR